MLFSIFFAMMLLVAFKDCNFGVAIQFCAEDNVFNVKRYRPSQSEVICELLFADDCALLAYTLQEAQQLLELCECSKPLWSKREHQEDRPGLPYTPPVVTLASKTLTISAT